MSLSNYPRDQTGTYTQTEGCQRVIYDRLNYLHSIAESVGPFGYATDISPYVSCGKDNQYYPTLINTMDRQNSRENPQGFSVIDNNNNLRNPPQADAPLGQFPPKMDREYPELDRHRPCDVLSGVHINRFDFLCENPQDPKHIFFTGDNQYAGDNTRTYVKDFFDVRSCYSSAKLPNDPPCSTTKLGCSRFK